jgi:DNA polymerase II small subunit
VGSDEQRRIAQKVNYVVFVGDLIEGVGVYPNQERDLSIPDVYKQYEFFYEYLIRIPARMQVIIIPGNHDTGRLSEPQPSLFFETMQKIAQHPNVLSLSNPCLINIGAHPDLGFPGFDLLIYHGGSIPYYSENLPSVRGHGGLSRVDLVMKYLLQRRHLAPTHSSTIYVPDPLKDPLLIDVVPDFFATGHIHKLSIASYRNVTLINASCWVGMSDYQEKRGIVPDPARLPLVNLRTREVKVLNFLGKEQEPDVPAQKEDLARGGLTSIDKPKHADGQAVPASPSPPSTGTDVKGVAV